MWTCLVSILMSVITRFTLQPNAGSPISISISPDYVMDWLTFFLVIFSFFTAIISFISIYMARKQYQDSQRQSAAALQLAREANATTLQTIEEMRAGRDQESAPYIVVYFDVQHPMIFIVVKNIGKSVATDIKLNIDPPFAVPLSSYNLNELSLFKDGTAALAPGSEIRSFYTSSISYFDPSKNYPRTYQVAITYKGGLSLEPRSHTMFLDLSAYEGTAYLNEKDLDDLVKEVEQIRKTFEEFNKTSKDIAIGLKKGLWIKNPMLLGIISGTDVVSNLTFIRTRLHEFQKKWQFGYEKMLYRALNEEERELVNSYALDTRNDCILLAQQTLLTLSQCQGELSQELSDKITQIVIMLFKLGKLDIYGFGENSTEGFNKLGEQVSKDVDSVIRLIGAYDRNAPERESNE